MSSNFCVKGIYADGMVLQRNTLNCIFGASEAGAEVSFSFRGKNSSVNADSEGNWKIEFNPGEAGGPFTLAVSCGNISKAFKDVFVGEVWLSSGQSNSQLTMERMKFTYPEEFNLPENPNIRMITIPIKWSFDGEKDSVENPTWICASPSTIGQMSGTSYFFAKKIQKELGVPVGIISCAQGGSPISSWINKKSLKELENSEKFISELETCENPENVSKKQKDLSANQKEWNELLNSSDRGGKESWEKISYIEIQNDWEDCTIPGFIDHKGTAGFFWFKKQINLSEEQVKHFNETKTWIWFGTIVDADKVWVNGVEVGETGYCYPPRRYVIPSGTLIEGRNTITIRVQKNSHLGHVRFYEEKPYYIFTENVKICPTAVRNVEHFEEELPENGEKVSISGQWKMKMGTSVEDAPNGLFFEWVPTALYNSMLAPCFNYAIRGALWYQGESDAWHPVEYYEMLKRLIALWREKFSYAPKDMPFVIMQLPNWSDGKGEDYISCDLGWAEMRQTQLNVSEDVQNTGLAVVIDAGEWNDLHPEKKRTGGTRAACEALRVAYGKNFNSSPKFEGIKQDGNKIIVKYQTGSAKLKTLSENKIPGFVFVCEHDGERKFIESEGVLVSENEVEVNMPEGCNALELRYLWSDSPNPINLYSTDELPAQSFKCCIK